MGAIVRKGHSGVSSYKGRRSLWVLAMTMVAQAATVLLLLPSSSSATSLQCTFQHGGKPLRQSALALTRSKISRKLKTKQDSVLISAFRPATNVGLRTVSHRFMLKEGYENSRNRGNIQQRRFVNSRRNIKIPLLILPDDDPIVFPMPMSHLPITEVSSLNLYGTELTSPAHIRMAREAIQNEQKLYGHVVSKATEKEDMGAEQSLVGSIGVACQIVSSSASGDGLSLSKVPEIGADFNAIPEGDAALINADKIDPERPTPTSIFVRGTFRFIVRDIVKTFPYPVAIVDELLDYEVDEFSLSETSEIAPSPSSALTDTEEEEEDDDDDDDDIEDKNMYNILSGPELVGRTLSAMKAHVQMRVEANPQSSLLELELGGGVTQGELERFSAEEMATVMEMFLNELVEMNDIVLRRYAVGMMAVEVLDLGFNERRQALITTNGLDRLRAVLALLEPKVSMERAKKMASEITGSDPETGVQKDLKIGRPGLPPWARQVQPGLKVEYYWNEEHGWCRATVKNAELVVDEILVTLDFDDGQTVIVPLNGEEKARWRPASNS